MRILLVEDDQLIVNILSKSLNTRNYSVDTVGDGAHAWEYLSTIDYDLVILDVLLPNLDGVSLCRRLRANNNDTPILILTSQNHSQAKVRGLDAGADDYLAKPFDIEELMARIRALIRRRGGDLFPVLQFGGLLLDPAQCSASYNGISLPLSTKEYALMELFLHNPQHVFSIPEILDSLWSSEEYPAEATVRSHIRRLRSRLIEAGAPKDFIANVHGRGYFLKFQAKAPTQQDRKEVIDERQFTLQTLKHTSAEQQYQQFLEETWQQFRPKAQQHIETIQQAIIEVQTESIGLQSAETAHFLSHRLAGTIGLFNQTQAQIAAQSLEAFFKALVEWLKIDCYREVRSRFSTHAEYLDPDSMRQKMTIIQSACQKLDHPKCPTQSISFVILNIVPQLTKALRKYAEQITLQLFVINNLNSFPSQAQDNGQSPILLIPFTDNLTWLNTQAPHLNQLKQSHPNLSMVGISNPMNFETRLQAVRLGLTYILDATHPPEELIQQVLQLTFAVTHQTHILLIDDDETWLQVMHNRLATFGFHVTSSSKPEHFWEVLESCHPDILMLDVKMPHVNGFEICRVLRSHPDWQALPVIFVSTAADHQTQQDGMIAGADAFISKQLNIDVIIRRILNRLRGKHSQQKPFTNALTFSNSPSV